MPSPQARGDRRVVEVIVRIGSTELRTPVSPRSGAFFVETILGEGIAQRIVTVEPRVG